MTTKPIVKIVEISIEKYFKNFSSFYNKAIIKPYTKLTVMKTITISKLNISQKRFKIQITI